MIRVAANAQHHVELQEELRTRRPSVKTEIQNLIPISYRGGRTVRSTARANTVSCTIHGMSQVCACVCVLCVGGAVHVAHLPRLHDGDVFLRGAGVGQPWPRQARDALRAAAEGQTPNTTHAGGGHDHSAAPPRQFERARAVVWWWWCGGGGGM